MLMEAIISIKTANILYELKENLYKALMDAMPFNPPEPNTERISNQIASVVKQAEENGYIEPGHDYNVRVIREKGGFSVWFDKPKWMTIEGVIGL